MVNERGKLVGLRWGRVFGFRCMLTQSIFVERGVDVVTTAGLLQQERGQAGNGQETGRGGCLLRRLRYVSVSCRISTVPPGAKLTRPELVLVVVGLEVDVMTVEPAVVTRVEPPETMVLTIAEVVTLALPKMVEAPLDVMVEPPVVMTVEKLEVEMATEPPLPLPPAPPPITLKRVVEPTVDVTTEPPLEMVETMADVVTGTEDPAPWTMCQRHSTQGRAQSTYTTRTGTSTSASSARTPARTRSRGSRSAGAVVARSLWGVSILSRATDKESTNSLNGNHDAGVCSNKGSATAPLHICACEGLLSLTLAVLKAVLDGDAGGRIVVAGLVRAVADTVEEVLVLAEALGVGGSGATQARGLAKHAGDAVGLPCHVRCRSNLDAEDPGRGGGRGSLRRRPGSRRGTGP